MLFVQGREYLLTIVPLYMRNYIAIYDSYNKTPAGKAAALYRIY
jgi:hypothetical protein